MTDLDRLLEIVAKDGRVMIPSESWDEFNEKKSQLESKLAESEKRENVMSILNKQDLAYDLMFDNYWDCSRHGSFWKLQTRQEYDLETCHAIRDFIIELIKTGGASIQSQHTNLVKAIQDLKTKYDKLFAELEPKYKQYKERSEGILDLSDQVDKIYARRYHEVKSIIQELQNLLESTKE